jgi:hypothetical protein
VRRVFGLLALALAVGACSQSSTSRPVATHPGATKNAEEHVGPWRPLPGVDVASSSLAGVWTGRELIVLAPSPSSPGSDSLRVLDGSTWTWRTATSPPGRGEGSVIWDGTEMLLVRSSSWAPDEARSVLAYLPSTDRWRQLPGRLPAGLTNAELSWTGREMLAWIAPEPGQKPSTSAFSLDPSSGTIRPLPTPPLSPRRGVVQQYTGHEWIVWGGDDDKSGTLGDGAAFDVTTRQWRLIAPSPVESRTSAVSAWTGTEFVVWGGETRCCEKPFHCPPGASCTGTTWDSHVLNDGATYDPARDVWTRLPDASIAGRFFASPEAANAVWTGTQVLIVGGSNLGWPAGTMGDGIAFRPSDNSWQTVPDAIGRIVGLGVWTGHEAIFLSRWSDQVHAAAFTDR